MEEMHETMKDQAAWQSSVASLTKNLKAKGNKSSSMIKHQTQSTLFNQYNLPDYMLQSPTRLTKNKKQSTNSLFNIHGLQSNYKKETPNLDLAHIEERVSQSKRQKQSHFSPKFKRPKGTNIKQQNSTTGFLAQSSDGIAQSDGMAQFNLYNPLESNHQSQDMESPLYFTSHYMAPMQIHNNNSDHNNQYGSSQSNDIIDQERLIKISNDKVREARAMAQNISQKEHAN